MNVSRFRSVGQTRTIESFFDTNNISLYVWALINWYKYYYSMVVFVTLILRQLDYCAVLYFLTRDGTVYTVATFIRCKTYHELLNCTLLSLEFCAVTSVQRTVHTHQCNALGKIDDPRVTTRVTHTASYSTVQYNMNIWTLQ